MKIATGLMIACMMAACAAGSMAADSGYDTNITQPPAKNTDGGVNTGTGTVPNGDLSDSGMSAVDLPPPPNGPTDKSGGINSGPSGSLRDTGTIPGNSGQ